MNREFTTVIDMVGRTCIRRCDNERFIFLFPKDNSCKEFIMYNMNKFNQHKGFIPDTPVMLPTIIKEEKFAKKGTNFLVPLVCLSLLRQGVSLGLLLSHSLMNCILLREPTQFVAQLLLCEL